MDYDRQAWVYSECCVLLHGRSEKVDYGVPGSPVWEEVNDIDVAEISLGRKTYTYNQLVAKIGKAATDWLVDALVDEGHNDVDWCDR